VLACGGMLWRRCWQQACTALWGHGRERLHGHAGTGQRAWEMHQGVY
jgi:hypothetical protein